MALIQPRPVNFNSSSADGRNNQPLRFSIDDQISSQHLTFLDLRSKNLKKIEKFTTNVHFNVVLLDSNQITKVEHLDVFSHLIELSISENRLIDIRLLSRLKLLKKINLSNNSIDSLDPLKSLTDLFSLNVSRNNLDNLSALIACRSLQMIDASDNSIRQIDDFSQLTSLKFLNLHRNLIDHFDNAGKFLPKSLNTLIISNNEIRDLTEFSSLVSLSRLKVFNVESNPCLFIVDDRTGFQQTFDHRPFVLSWCSSIENLDDFPVSREENSKADWLLAQGKVRSFRVGEHFQLVQYLMKICPIVNEERRRTFSNENQNKNRRSLLISESEFVEISSAPSPSTKNEPKISPNLQNKYDNRPIKPLNQQVFQSELNQYPIENLSNSNRISPKSTSHGPTASTAMQIKPRTKSISQRVKRHTIAAINDQKITFQEKKNKTNRKNPSEMHEDDPSMKSSILRAFLELHERYSRTVNLHNSALISLWERFEEEKREKEKLLEENRLLNERIRKLETTANRPHVQPPIRVHISKRDTKSFFLNWSSNPENNSKDLIGYRIFIDDVEKFSTGNNQFQVVIDSIREEGEFRIKVRSFTKDEESTDSNVVVAHFRRQRTDSNSSERNSQTSEQSISTSPNNVNTLNNEENFLSAKPPTINSTSPTGTGLMSRFVKQSVKVKRNNVLLNGLPQNSNEINSKNLGSSSEYSGQISGKSSNSF